MNKGQKPDESEDDTLDSGKDESLEAWIDRDSNNEDPDPEFMAYEQIKNGQDGQEEEEV